MSGDIQPIRAVPLDQGARRETARIVWDLLTAVGMIAVGVWTLSEVLRGKDPNAVG